MSDDEKKLDPEANEPVSETAEEGKPEKLFNQSEVNKIVQDRLARQKLADQKPKSQPVEHKTQPIGAPPEVAQLQQQVQALLQKQEAFEVKEAIMSRGVTNPSAVDLLLHAHQTVKPDDLGSWLDSMASVVSGSKPEAPASEPEAQKEEPAPAALIPSTPAPAGGTDFTGQVDVTQLTGDDVRNLQQSGRFMDVLEKYRRTQQGGPVFGRKRQLPKG